MLSFGEFEPVIDGTEDSKESITQEPNAFEVLGLNTLADFLKQARIEASEEPDS